VIGTLSRKASADQVVATFVKSTLFLYANKKYPKVPRGIAKYELPKMDGWLRLVVGLLFPERARDKDTFAVATLRLFPV
jgi:hypothetical protein